MIKIIILAILVFSLQANAESFSVSVVKKPVLKHTIKIIRYDGGCLNVKKNKRLVMWCA